MKIRASMVSTLTGCAAAFVTPVACGHGSDDSPVAVTAVETDVFPAWSDDLSRPTFDTRLWFAHRRVAFGVSLSSEFAIPLAFGHETKGKTLPPSMLMGMRYDLGARSRLYFDTTAATRDMRMGFEFKPAPSRTIAAARGTLFRVQWSSRSQLSLRLRGGGIAVALRSQF